MFRRGPGRLEMCFYAYKNVLEPMGHLGANLIFSILTLNQATLGWGRVGRWAKDGMWPSCE